MFNKKSKRIADDDIYLNQNNYSKPKEIFKKCLEIIKNKTGGKNSLCDIGCATGEFVFFVKKQIPNCEILGIDKSPKLIKKAKENVKNVEFIVDSVESLNKVKGKKFDIITVNGLIGMFDDPRKILKKIFSISKSNGLIIISGAFNPEPIDVLTRYRRAKNKSIIWELGWNIHSCYTIENVCKKIDPNVKITWHDFIMPFSLKKQNDPLRTWTIKNEKKENILVLGTSQIIHMKVLEINRNKKNE